jgi:hypothetical protein
MLAYMDDILEPADAQDIAKKIEESKFASDLMHRIRDVTRRLRLAAPKLEGRGMGLDPNTVAEYLDNTLPSERVADFEKVCLESDVHLAEVASCHQILALVLGEPAELDEKSRQRMYGLINQPQPAAATSPAPPPAPSQAAASAAEQPVPAGAAARVEPPAPPVDNKPRAKPEVPEYLREPTAGSRSRMLLALAAMVLVVVGILAIINAKKINEILAQVQGISQNVENSEKSPESATVDNTTDDKAVKPAESAATPPTAASTTGQAPPAPPASNQAPPAPPANANPQPPSQLAQPMPQIPTSPPGNPPPVAPLPNETPIPRAPVATTPAAPPALTPAPNTTPPALTPAGTPPVATTPAPAPAPAPAPGATPPTTPMPLVGAPPTLVPPQTATPNVPPAVVDTKTPGTTPTPPRPADVAAAPEGLGRLVSEHELLLRYDNQTQTWRRLTARAILFAGDRLLCLPTYHANLGFGVGVNVEMQGSTAIELTPPDSRGVPGIRLTQGRLKIFTVGRPEAQLRLALGERQGTIGFGDADSNLAVEARRIRAEGTDPEKEPAILELDLYATAGQIAWSDPSSPRPQLLSTPTLLTITAAGELPAAPGITLPPWTKADEVTPLQRRGSTVLEEALTPDRPITLGLKELAGDRRPEVNSLAVQCLAQIGEFESFPPLLNDEMRRAGWEDQISALRNAIALGPQTAAKVKMAFVNECGEQKGLELYRMLWGYTAAELQAGEAAKLVAYLDNNELDFRVMAFSALVRITGQTHFYRPEYTPAAKRATYVAKWKQRLDTGQLIPKTTDKRP